MGIGAYISGFEFVDYHTELAGTAITENIQAQDAKRLALVSAIFTCAGTAHNLRFMFARGTGSRNTTSAGAAAGQAVINTVDNPLDPAGNAAANNDVIAYQCTDGTWEFNLVQGIVAKAVTCQANLVKAVAAGAKVMIFGVVADASYLTLHGLANTQNFFQSRGAPVLAHPFIGEPFYLYDLNDAAAGSLDNIVFAHIDK
jgi:hypothetical protein